jgi:hypothetical protein
MPVTFKEVLKKFTPTQRARIETHAQELIEEELTLHERRQAQRKATADSRMTKKKQTAGENIRTGTKQALAVARGEKDASGVTQHQQKGQLFLCFWDIALDNLPEGSFSHRRIPKEDARSRVESARQAGRLFCVSNDDLLAPYRKREAQKHKELCAVLSEQCAISLSLKDFVTAMDHGEKPLYTIAPLQCVQVQGKDQLLVVTCNYTMPTTRNKSLLNLQISPETVEFHLIEAS